MTVKVLYFAGLREALGTGREEMPIPTGVTTVAGLRDLIVGRGEPWAQLGQTKALRCAVNQAMAGFDTVIKEGDEIAFFPPVTGG